MKLKHPGPLRRSTLYILLALTILLGLCAPFAASAESRVALVIGNSAYQNVSRLTNPTGDAQAIAATLKGLGFDTLLVVDQDGAGLKQALRSFGAKAKGADIAAIYYAGHGMEAGGQNYLVPVDAGLKTEDDIDYELVPLDLVLRAVSGATRLRLVMLDACRNNPFAAQIAGVGGTRGVGRGFARVEPANNTLVAYAAKAGTTADDGDGAHSPFATALLANLAEPGQEIRLVFGKVRDDVLAATGSVQEPFVYGSLGGAPIYLALGGAGDPVAAPAGGTSNEAVFWQSIKDSTNPAMFQAYLKRYPNGDFVDLAAAKLAELPPAQTAALTPQAPAAAAEAVSEIEDLDATYVALRSSNIRAEPSTDAKILGKLAEDEAVAVTGRVKSKDWLRIDLNQQAGFVSSKLLAKADAGEIAAWGKVKRAPSEVGLQSFMKNYPDGFFAPKAEALLEEIERKSEDAALQESPAAVRLSGDALARRIEGNTELTETNAVHAWIYYEPGGAMRRLSVQSYGSQKMKGRWWVDGERVCYQDILSYADTVPVCRAVEISALLAGNPKGL